MRIAPVKSPWGGYDVYVLPDDDDEARAQGWPDDVIAATTPERISVNGADLFVRAGIWGLVRAEFEELGNRH